MQRLAVATFVVADQLGHAVRELTAESIKPDQLCLIGTAPRIAEITAAMAAATQPLPGSRPDGVLDLSTLSDGARLVATPAHFDRVDFGAELQPQGLLHGLQATLSDGAIALLVRTRSVSEFTTATRILLRYSPNRVRTREVHHPYPPSE